MQIEVGDIVFCHFPKDEGGTLRHYALVLDVKHSAIKGTVYRVAYGSSKKVSATGHLEHEFVLHREEDLERARLTRPTRFDLRKLTTLERRDIIRVEGRIALESQRIKRDLRRAVEAVIY